VHAAVGGRQSNFTGEAAQLEKELKSMMALKADKHEVEDVKNSKSNKADADLTLSFID
jgi:hypothetical protein